MKTKHIEPHQWWSNLSGGERRLICAIMRMLKSAKRSQIREVARAAAKWETGIGCFIKVRLIHYPPRLRSSSSSSSTSGPKLLTAGGSSTCNHPSTQN